MSDEFGHTTNAPNAQKCTKDNWEDTAKHAADSQAANDMLYCDGTYWKRATRAAILALLSGQAGADFSMNTNKLTSVKDPTTNQDAATKKYVDDHAADVDAHGEPTITTDDGVATGDDQALNILGGEGISTSGTGSTVTIAGEDASITNKGIVQLDDTAGGVNGEVSKAVTPNVVYDHAVATTGIHGVATGTIASVSTANKTIYVDLAATGAADGTSWTDAFTTIQAAVDSMEDIIIHAYTISVRAGTKKTGTADQNEANKLHDADGGFASGDVGKAVFNITDGTWGRVAAFVDSGELTLDADSFPDGDEDYVIIGTPYRETVYLNSNPTVNPAHVIIGSLVIQAENYFGGDCEANAVQGKIVDTGAFANVQLGDRVYLLQISATKAADYDLCTVTSLIDNDSIGTDSTKTPTYTDANNKWRYTIVRTEISGSDDGTDGGTARSYCNYLRGIDNVTVNGFYMTFSDSTVVYCGQSRRIIFQYCIFENCDYGFAIAEASTDVRLYYSYMANTALYSMSIAKLVYCAVQWSAFEDYIWVYQNSTVFAHQNIHFGSAYAYKVEDNSAVWCRYSTITNGVTTGFYARYNSVIRDDINTNNAITPEDPAVTSEGAYIS